MHESLFNSIRIKEYLVVFFVLDGGLAFAADCLPDDGFAFEDDGLAFADGGLALADGGLPRDVNGLLFWVKFVEDIEEGWKKKKKKRKKKS